MSHSLVTGGFKALGAVVLGAVGGGDAVHIRPIQIVRFLCACQGNKPGPHRCSENSLAEPAVRNGCGAGTAQRIPPACRCSRSGGGGSSCRPTHPRSAALPARFFACFASLSKPRQDAIPGERPARPAESQTLVPPHSPASGPARTRWRAAMPARARKRRCGWTWRVGGRVSGLWCRSRTGGKLCVVSKQACVIVNHSNAEQTSAHQRSAWDLASADTRATNQRPGVLACAHMSCIARLVDKLGGAPKCPRMVGRG